MKILIRKFLLFTFLINLSSCIHFDKTIKSELLKEKALKICRSVNRNSEEAWYSYVEKEQSYFKARNKAVNFNSNLQENLAECDKAFTTKNRNLSEIYQIELLKGLQKISDELMCASLPEVKSKLSSSDYLLPINITNSHLAAKKHLEKSAEISDAMNLLQNLPVNTMIIANNIRQCLAEYKSVAFQLKLYKNKITEIKNQKTSLAKSLGYSDMWMDQGISGIIASINSGDLSVNAAQKFLIERSINFDASIAVEEIIGNMVIYSSLPTNIFDRHFRFATQKEKGKFYGKKSILEGGHFIITGNRSFKIDGKTSDLLVLKNLNVNLSVKKMATKKASKKQSPRKLSKKNFKTKF